MDYMSVGEVARKLGVRPPQVSDLFCKGVLRDDLCPVIAGRRLVSPEIVPVIAMELRRKGIEIRSVEGSSSTALRE